MSASSEYIVEATTINSSIIKQLSEALKSILTEANMVFDADGIHMVTMNNPQTVLVHLYLQGKKFQKYNCSQRTLVGFDTEHFHKLLRTMGAGDVLTMYVKRNNPNKLGLLIENAEKKLSTRFELSLLDVDEQKIEIPDAKFNSVITMKSAEFQNLVRNMYTLSKQVEIKNIGSMLTFSLKGSFTTQDTTLGETSDGIQVKKEDGSGGSDGIIEGVFSLEHLATITKCTGLCDHVKLYMKNDYPLMVKYSVDSMGDITFCLVPIESASS